MAHDDEGLGALQRKDLAVDAGELFENPLGQKRSSAIRGLARKLAGKLDSCQNDQTLVAKRIFEKSELVLGIQA